MTTQSMTHYNKVEVPPELPSTSTSFVYRVCFWSHQELTGSCRLYLLRLDIRFTPFANCTLDDQFIVSASQQVLSLPDNSGIQHVDSRFENFTRCFCSKHRSPIAQTPLHIPSYTHHSLEKGSHCTSSLPLHYLPINLLQCLQALGLRLYPLVTNHAKKEAGQDIILPLVEMRRTRPRRLPNLKEGTALHLSRRRYIFSSHRYL